MLPDVSGDHLAVLRSCVVQDPLDEVVAVLVAGNIDEWDTSTILATFADSIEVATQEISASNLEALFNHLGRELIRTVLGCVANDMVDGSAAVRRATMLADVLDAPVSKLAMGDDVYVGKNFLDAWALLH